MAVSIVQADGIGGKLSPIEAKCIVECREGLYSPGSRCLNPNLDFLNSLYVGWKDCGDPREEFRTDTVYTPILSTN